MNVQALLDALNKAQNETDLNPIAVWAIARYLHGLWKDEPDLVIRPYSLGKAMSDFFVDLSQHRLPEKIINQTPETEPMLMEFFGAKDGSLSKFWTQNLEIWQVTLAEQPDFAAEVKKYFVMLQRSSLLGNKIGMSRATPESATAETVNTAQDIPGKAALPVSAIHADEPEAAAKRSAPAAIEPHDPIATTDGPAPAGSSAAPEVIQTESEAQEKPEPETLSKNAYLILQGTRVIPLNQSFIKIGRQLDNHIILEDPRVSRSHAQLKLVNDRYVIFDMQSTGGTFVNGKKTNQSVLYPGDVVSLAGVVFIYSQELPAKPGTINVIELGSRYAADRPTAVMHREEVKPITKTRDLPDLPKTGPLKE